MKDYRGIFNGKLKSSSLIVRNNLSYLIMFLCGFVSFGIINYAINVEKYNFALLILVSFFVINLVFFIIKLQDALLLNQQHVYNREHPYHP